MKYLFIIMHVDIFSRVLCIGRLCIKNKKFIIGPFILDHIEERIKIKLPPECYRYSQIYTDMKKMTNTSKDDPSYAYELLY